SLFFQIDFMENLKFACLIALNLNSSYNFGFLVAMTFVLQIITGITLAFRYTSEASCAFASGSGGVGTRSAYDSVLYPAFVPTETPVLNYRQTERCGASAI
ncbi:hypothetical protein TGVEG_239300B, partial [Toxoplasma gondii VEG]